MKWALKRDRQRDGGGRPAIQSVTVSELTRRIKGDLEQKYNGLWVEGEISGCRYHGSGHVYFTLKDAGAQISGVIWRLTARRLPLRLEDGMKVLAFGRVSLYAPRGNYQLVVDRIEPQGAGQLQLAFEQLKARLDAEGLFDPDLKKPLPKFPKSIGIVTSATGAALRDVLQVLGRRYPQVDVIVAPARVQGPGSVDDVVRALSRLDRRDDIDVILVTRGGGSLEDLWTFNEEAVVRAIFACETPVMSAVGHEIDHTLADFVADDRAPTPSAAAEQLVPDGAALKAWIEEAQARSRQAMIRRLDDARFQVSALSERLRDPRMTLGHHAQRLGQNQRSLERAMAHFLLEKRRAVELASGALKPHAPQEKLARQAEMLSTLDHRLRLAIAHHLKAKKQALGAQMVNLEALSPLGVLKRGYALVTDEDAGTVVQRPPPVGTRLRIRLAEGELRAKVVDDEA